MSQLMSESLDLSYLQNSDYTLNLDDEQGNVKENMALLAEKAEEGNKRRELKVLNIHLKGVHERVSHVLNEAGYSSELPEPRLEDATTFSFRPPEFCIQPETKETEEQKIVKRTCVLFMECAKTRNDLIKSVEEWMGVTSSGLEGRNMRSIEQALARRQSEAMKSKGEVAKALHQAEDAVMKLMSIGKSVFDEKSDEGTEKSSMPEQTLARVNARVRRHSEAIDAVPYKKRAHMMQRMFHEFEEVPGDTNDLIEKYDITDEDERALVDEMTSEWRTACNDIWDLLISMHEVKMLQRMTRLKIRRVLYIFKLVIAVLEIRDGMVRTAEEQLLDAQTEVVGLKAKLGHLHSETKKMREKWTKTQSIVVRISKERDESKFESEKLRDDLAACIDKIAELNSLVRELKTEAVKSAKQAKQEDAAENQRNLELNDVTKKQDSRIETMQLEIDKLSLENDEIKRKMEETILKDKENEFLLEQRIHDVEGKLEQSNITNEELSGKVESLQEDLLEKEKEFELLKVDLEAKGEVIAKLTSLTADSDSDNEPPPTRRRSLATRRSSRAQRKTHCQTEDETRQRQIEGPNYEKRQSISQLARASSTKLLRRSSVRLIPSSPRFQTPCPTPSIPAVIVPSEENGGDHNRPSTIVLQEATTQVSAVAMTIQNDEYLRVREGWEESERRCKELEINLADVEDELTGVLKKQKKRLSIQAREFRMKAVLGDEEHRAQLSAVYAEALNMETMVNRYKNDLSVILERALLPKIAKDVKTAYNFNSADNPTDHAASLKITNQWIDVALKKLAKCQQSVIRHMQNAQHELKMKAEQAVGQETAHHVKVLAEKSREMERYRNQVDRARNDANALKTENQKLSRLNEQTKEKLRTFREEGSRLKEQWKKRERELLEAGEAMSSYKKAMKDVQKMETKIRDLKADFKKLQSQLEATQQALARESKLRMAAERAARGRRPSLTLVTREEKRPAARYAQQKEKPRGPSQSTVHVKTLEKLLDMGPTLRLSHISVELVNEAGQTVKNYKKGVTARLRDLCRRYITFRQRSEMLERIRTAIMGSKVAAKEKRDIRAKWRDATDKIQQVYWHLQSRQERRAKHNDLSEIQKLLSHYRDDLSFVFKRVAQVLLKRKQDQNDDSTARPQEDEGVETVAKHSSESAGDTKSANLTPHLHPVAPSNSVMSFDSVNTGKTSSIGTSSMQIKAVPSDRVENTTSSVHAQSVGKPKSDEEFVEGAVENSESIRISAKSSLIEKAEAKVTKRTESTHQIFAGHSNHRMDVVVTSSRRVFARSNSLAPDVSDEYKKNQSLVSAITNDTEKRNSVASPAPSGPTWDRRLSLATPLTTTAWVPRSSKGRKLQEKGSKQSLNIMPDVPKTLQLDVHGFLHKARKQLQDSIRRQSVDGSADRRPSTTLSELGSFMRSRRATITGGILPGVSEGGTQRSRDHAQLLKRIDSGLVEHAEKKSSPEKRTKSSDSLEVEVVQPPANRSLTKSPKSSTKFFTRRPSIRRKSTAASADPKQAKPIERKLSMRERFEGDLKDRDLKKVDRCLSDDLSTASSLVEGLGRRKSTSDAVTLPSVSSTSTSNR